MYRIVSSQFWKILVTLSVALCTTTPALASNWYTWAEADATSSQINVYLGEEQDGKPKQIIKLSESGANLTPVASIRGNILWAVWVDRADPGRHVLRYTRINLNKPNRKKVGYISTGDNKIYSPFILATPLGVFVAWSAFDGKDEEIRLAEYRQGQWNAETSLTDNDVPDTLPVLSLSADKLAVQLSWEQLSDVGIDIHEYDVTQKRKVPARLSRASKADTAKAKLKARSDRRAHYVDQAPAFLGSRSSQYFMGSRVETVQ